MKPFAVVVLVVALGLAVYFAPRRPPCPCDLCVKRGTNGR